MTDERWTKVSPWRLYFMALAIKNGHCPKLAEERHRKWCIAMGFETEGEDEGKAEASEANDTRAPSEAD